MGLARVRSAPLPRGQAVLDGSKTSALSPRSTGGRQSSFLLSPLFSYQYIAAAPIAAPITNVNILARSIPDVARVVHGT